MPDTTAPAAAAAQPDPADLAAFKAGFRRHAAGVAIVTARDSGGRPVGFTATSLASLAAVPPLATFNMARTASSWRAIEETEHVVIHLLGLRNQGLARRMAGPAAERFEGDHWSEGPHGLPLLHDVTAWMTGRIVERLHVHGNAVVVVQVEDGGTGADDDALLYHDRRWLRPVHLEA
ncbi:flavin reductase family protein [Frigoribacterium sp. PhB116]|uniref:flavin reductase family protein n=1 Tax=Frigoribacterium sp. PhB116 TaxID=2485174 RepID=UPI001061C6E9|nr:flavin reductase family protein [Frigoribacterium sp. PhB116]TDT65405.1 flavin reductase (DIM6/NTAB) family NADH-FMN oxidoreductase RutF [Frigoribacterium sp. PhB116]